MAKLDRRRQRTMQCSTPLTTISTAGEEIETEKSASNALRTYLKKNDINYQELHVT
jgi:hypothetical protein